MIKRDVSSAELEVMRLIWAADKPVIVSDIWKAVEGHEWTYQTVLTFINRLNMKGFLKVVGKRVRSFEYLPRISRAEYIAETRGNLLDGGSGATIADFVKEMYAKGKCSDDDIQELSEILEKLKNGKAK